MENGNGISIYAGLNCSLEENITLMETAASLNLNRIFTSAAIPEAVDTNFDFAAILTFAIENNFEIIVDVTPLTISNFDFEQFVLRLDDGFAPIQIAALSHFRNIMLNASTVNEKLLLELVELNANFDNISALHNFYPHIYTGLDVDYFSHQNNLLHKFGILVGAFVASLNGRRRPPFEEGLPTLELTRNLSTDLSSRYLTALGTDFIIISDALPTPQECIALSKITPQIITLETQLLIEEPLILDILSNNPFLSRPEISPHVIRAADSRHFFKNVDILPDNNPQPRKRGDIIIDNSNFGRYMGEIQIVKTDLPPDPRVNKIAHVFNDNLPMIDCITSNTSFSFRLLTGSI